MPPSSPAPTSPTQGSLAATCLAGKLASPLWGGAQEGLELSRSWFDWGS